MLCSLTKIDLWVIFKLLWKMDLLVLCQKFPHRAGVLGKVFCFTSWHLTADLQQCFGHVLILGCFMCLQLIDFRWKWRRKKTRSFRWVFSQSLCVVSGHSGGQSQARTDVVGEAVLRDAVVMYIKYGVDLQNWHACCRICLGDSRWLFFFKSKGVLGI